MSAYSVRRTSAQRRSPEYSRHREREDRDRDRDRDQDPLRERDQSRSRSRSRSRDRDDDKYELEDERKRPVSPSRYRRHNSDYDRDSRRDHYYPYRFTDAPPPRDSERYVPRPGREAPGGGYYSFPDRPGPHGYYSAASVPPSQLPPQHPHAAFHPQLPRGGMGGMGGPRRENYNPYTGVIESHRVIDDIMVRYEFMEVQNRELQAQVKEARARILLLQKRAEETYDELRRARERVRDQAVTIERLDQNRESMQTAIVQLRTELNASQSRLYLVYRQLRNARPDMAEQLDAHIRSQTMMPQPPQPPPYSAYSSGAGGAGGGGVAGGGSISSGAAGPSSSVRRSNIRPSDYASGRSGYGVSGIFGGDVPGSSSSSSGYTDDGIEGLPRGGMGRVGGGDTTGAREYKKKVGTARGTSCPLISAVDVPEGTILQGRDEKWYISDGRTWKKATRVHIGDKESFTISFDMKAGGERQMIEALCLPDS